MKPRITAALFGLALYSAGLLGAVLLNAGAHAAEPSRFFDDFGYTDVDQLPKEGGWTLRDGPGHPGIDGAQWRADAIDPALTQQAFRPEAKPPELPENGIKLPRACAV